MVFVSFILAYAGIESSASHVKDIENLGKNYPKAILMLAILTILLDILGGVTVAATIPQDHLSLNTGVIQAYFFFNSSFLRKRMVCWCYC